MKLSILFLLLAPAIMYSCNSNPAGRPSSKTDTVFTTSCYLAVDGKDSAMLTLKSFSKKTEGRLIFNYAGKDKNDGNITGAFKGDTLFVDYGFRVGRNEAWHRNPLVFLKKDGKLIMGIGEMETTMGKTYFKKDVPIDFEQGRFIFEPVDCK